VADTGQGIAPEHLPHVFERFFRVPGHSRGGGTGLGLAIAREIVIAHGGTITCDSRPGAGTVFRLTLPVWDAAPANIAGCGLRVADSANNPQPAEEGSRAGR
jgi:signal transduction histidine kinase